MPFILAFELFNFISTLFFLTSLFQCFSFYYLLPALIFSLSAPSSHSFTPSLCSFTSLQLLPYNLFFNCFSLYTTLSFTHTYAIPPSPPTLTTVSINLVLCNLTFTEVNLLSEVWTVYLNACAVPLADVPFFPQ